MVRHISRPISWAIHCLYLFKQSSPGQTVRRAPVIVIVTLACGSAWLVVEWPARTATNDAPFTHVVIDGSNPVNPHCKAGGDTNGNSDVVAGEHNLSDPASAKQVASVNPGLFAANANGQGVAAAAVAQRIGAGFVVSFERVAQFAPAQPNFAGLDQLNVRVPRSLIGRGEVDVAVRVDGRAANTARVSVK